MSVALSLLVHSPKESGKATDGIAPVVDGGEDVGEAAVELVSGEVLVVLLALLEDEVVLEVVVLDVVEVVEEVDVLLVLLGADVASEDGLVTDSVAPLSSSSLATRTPPMQHRRTTTSTMPPAIPTMTPVVSPLRGGGCGSGRSSCHDPPGGCPPPHPPEGGVGVEPVGGYAMTCMVTQDATRRWHLPVPVPRVHRPT